MFCTPKLPNGGAIPSLFLEGNYSQTNSTDSYHESTYNLLPSKNETTRKVEVGFMENGNGSHSNFDFPHPPGPSTPEIIEAILNNRIILIICLFGLLGNILNLVVLSRRHFAKSMDRMEKSAHVGLVALAISDLFFCLVVIPHTFVVRKFSYDSQDIHFYFTLFGDALINIFITSSTWLTVAMATSRYLAICHPLRAREIIGMTFAKVSIIAVFIVSIVFNIPRFFFNSYEEMECQEGHSVYFEMPGYMKQNPLSLKAYLWTYFILGILIPLFQLGFCNGQLIRTLLHAKKMRKEYTQGKRSKQDSMHHITLTFVAIVIMYFVLVTPAEIINFIKDTVASDAMATHWFNVGLSIANTLQALNFAMNFVLYCAINVHFRRVCRDIFCCFVARKRKDMRYTSVSHTNSMSQRKTSTYVTEATV